MSLNLLQRRSLLMLAAPLLLLSILFSIAAHAVEETPTSSDGPETAIAAPKPSHRLIIELDAPSLAATFYAQKISAANNKSAVQSSRLNTNQSNSQSYIAQLQIQQEAFINSMQAIIPDAQVSTYINELGVREQATYQVVFNGVAIDSGSMGPEAARARLARMDGVKAVYYDMPHVTQLYTSTALINAPMVWNSPKIGGIEFAGAGIKFASMDGGVHKDAPMMDGSGYEYPAEFGPDGIGLTDNNNGKIIASRAYFRDWDPPSIGDENPWPGVSGTSHGMHTASTAAGDVVEDAEYLGLAIGTMSGVAPKAYVMSYRVFYSSVAGNDSFYTVEGIAALEDIVKDGADVVQNSWGGGPLSEGGPFDPLDTALNNAVKAGVFVSMSAGNSGPNMGTGDHPSPDYINVAATTTGGTLAAGQLNIVGNDNLQELSFGTGDFGVVLDLGAVLTFPFVTAVSVDPANAEGCNPFPAGAFDGVAAVISRGSCFFSDKAYNAEQAGAAFVLIYNNKDGDEILNMSCGSYCGPGEINIAAVLISQNNGMAVMDHFDENGVAGSTVELSTLAFQVGNDVDIVTAFSSRGPGVGNVLKPDIAAPGVNILAQGYTQNVIGEARHLGYGQVSGTSMAGPHVAGAAVLLRQLYPKWSPAAIKSALMSTSQYLSIYNPDGSPAQPLDMGAGRLDINAATDPGIILDPPSLSFGVVSTGTQQTISIELINITDAAENYTINTLYTGDGFTQTTDLPGFTVTPDSINLEPNSAGEIVVTIDTLASAGMGDNQGYVVLTGDQGHEAHLPVWARVSYAESLANVLVLDNDGSSSVGNYDYLWYYTSALDELGFTYEVIDADANFASAATIPDTTRLAAYDAIIHFTGDNYQPDGSFPVSTALTQVDKDRLVEYLNGGGAIIAMGQDLASALDTAITDPVVADTYYASRLGANYIQDSVTKGRAPTQLIMPDAEAPRALVGTIIDLTRANKLRAGGVLLGENEIPPVNTAATGEFSVFHDIPQNLQEFSVQVAPTTTIPITVTGIHIHTGAADGTGPIVRTLDVENVLPLYITDTLTLSGIVTPSLTTDEVALMEEGGLYINVHTTDNPSGELRGQILPTIVDNHLYVDEVDNEFHDGSQNPINDLDNLSSVPLFRYAGPYNVYNGTVALANHDQPSLERAGTTYSGRSIYTSFGLEGMNEEINVSNGFTPTTRSELLGSFLAWTGAEASAANVSNTTPANSSDLHILTATLAQGTPAQVRWDFGDDTEYVVSGTDTAGHRYTACGTFTVRAEITDTFGNVSIGDLDVEVDKSCAIPLVVSMSAHNTTVAEIGAPAAIMLSYENSGNRPLSTVLEMVVPAGTTFSGNSDARWSCAAGDAAGMICRLSVINLDAGTSDSALFEVIVDAPPLEESNISFAAAAPQSLDGSVTLSASGEDVRLTVVAPTGLDTMITPAQQRIFLPVINQ